MKFTGIGALAWWGFVCCLAIALSGLSATPAQAQAGVTCPAVSDGGNFDGGANIQHSRQILNNATASCSLEVNLTDKPFPTCPAAADEIRVCINVFGTTPTFGVSVGVGANSSNAMVDSAAYASGTLIPTDYASAFAATFQYDFNGATFTFEIAKFANSLTLEAFTVMAAATGPTESDTLTNQQSSLSNLVVTFQSNNLGDVVFDQLGNAFGPGTGPQVSASGFSASTRGVAAWMGDKQKQKLESQLADLPRDADGTEVYVTPVAALMPVQKPAWNAWIKGSWMFYDGDGSSFDGHTLDLLAGVDYRVDETVVMGLLAGYGNTDFDTEVAGTRGSFKADGYSVGPYVAARLSENVQVDALAAYTYSDYDNRSGATTGDFVAHRVTVAAQLKGMWTADDFFIEPGIRIVYAEEEQNAYTDSAAVAHSRLKVRAGRVSVGPKIGYSHTTADGDTIRPWVAVKGEYDFSNQGGVPTSGLPDLDDVLSARVSLGIDATMKDGTGISVQGDVSGLGGGAYTGYGGTARIDIPF